MHRTNIVIDEALLAEAKAASGARTARKVVELGLKALIDQHRTANAAAELRALRQRLSLGDMDWRTARDAGRR
jgi:Arc/MetJ family transcription regulator